MNGMNEKGNVDHETSRVLVQHTNNHIKFEEALETPSNQGNKPLLVIDGESEVDDMLLAACFANYESAALKRMALPFEIKPVSQTFSENATEHIIKAHNIQCITDDDEDKLEEEDDEEDDVLTRGLEQASASDPAYESSEDNTLQNKKGKETYENSKESTKTQSLCGFKPIVLENLPDMVNNSITLIHIGKVRSKMGKTVVIESINTSKPVDLGSVLCTSSRYVLGIVSDTFGPVASPFYLVCDIKIDVSEAEDIFADGNNFTFVFNENDTQSLCLKRDDTETESTHSPCQNMQRHLKRNKSKSTHLIFNKPHIKKNIPSQILNKSPVRKNLIAYQDMRNSFLHQSVDNSFINKPRCQQKPPWSYQMPQAVNPHLTDYTHNFHESLPSNMPNPVNSRTLDFPSRSLWKNVSTYVPSQSVPTQFLSSQCVANRFSSNQYVPNHFAESPCQSGNTYNGVQPLPPQFFSTHTAEHQNPDPFQQPTSFTYRFDN